MIWMKTIVLGAIGHLRLGDLRGRKAAPFHPKAPLVGYIMGICWGSQTSQSVRCSQWRKWNQDPKLLLYNCSNTSPVIYREENRPAYPSSQKLAFPKHCMEVPSHKFLQPVKNHYTSDVNSGKSSSACWKDTVLRPRFNLIFTNLTLLQHLYCSYPAVYVSYSLCFKAAQVKMALFMWLGGWMMKELHLEQVHVCCCQHQSLLNYAAGNYYTQQGYFRMFLFPKFRSLRLSRILSPVI